MKYKLKIKNDILYLFLLLTVTQFFNYSVLRAPLRFLVLLGVVGLLLLETWFIRAFSIYSGKKVSKYSDVIIRISLKDRFFGYFILPAIFYVSLLFFLFFNRNEMLGYVVLAGCMVLLLVLFLNVKSSLNKLYSLAIATRAIFDFICITIFYLLLNSYIRIGFGIEMFTILTILSSLVLLVFVLKIHNRLGFIEFLVSILSSLVVSLFTIFFWNYNIFVIPAVGALAFYLIISIWNIRFSGKIKFVDYLIPFLYVAIAIILVLNI
ncbi:MAG: transmembrane(s)protein [candidate division WS6 bacterium 36_33]|uniref:Transmembrane(S)protein n=1 Tax=candidate division WS6 bacterium 36_33 TaxID=1641388 RepID=A0A117LU37_9BACT|nr:MAG: transmembrane(s)protein [candidate division WS6 bacterium 36_33]